MKKIIITALLALSVFPACNSKPAIQDISETQQNVNIQSNQGANSYVEKYIKFTFDYSDKNKDGAISLDEIANETYFNSIDKNKDGKILINEFEKAAKEGSVNKEFFRNSLVNIANKTLNLEVFKYSEQKKTYEGSITKEQFIFYVNNIMSNYTKEPLSIFYISDKNNDGKINFSEFEDAMFGLAKSFLDRYFDNNANISKSSLPITNN
ncbi:MAG: EF-hand domain-containing protein [Candidatus Sericytochromatia bacterium]